MEILNSYSGSSAAGFHSARYSNLIDLDYNFKFLGEVFRVDDLLDFTNEELAPPIGDSGVVKKEEDGQGDGQGEEERKVKSSHKVKAEEGGEEEDEEEEEEEEGGEGEEEEEEEEADDFQDRGLTGTVDVEVSKEEELELIGNMHCDIPELEWLSSFVDDPSSIDHETDGGGAGAAAVKYAGTAYPFKSTARDYREFRDEVINVSNSDHHHHHQHPTSRLITATSTTSAWKDSSRRSSSGGGGYMEMVPAAGSVRGRSRSKRARGGTNTKLWYSTTSAAAPSSSTSSGNSDNSNFSNTSEGQVEDTSTTNLRVQQQCCSSSFSAEESDGGGYDNEDLDEFIMPARPVKKVCKGKKQDTSQLQKCLHCGSQKTPQWRTGPLGPKTLCNACGVRFKSGRLFPEYRPAASPSFVPQKHSNSHKKVLEMRRMKESDKSTTTTTTTTRSTTTTTGATSTDDEAGF